MKKAQIKPKTLMIVAAILFIIASLLFIKAAPLLGLNIGTLEILLGFGLMVTVVVIPSIIYIYIAEKHHNRSQVHEDSVGSWDKSCEDIQRMKKKRISNKTIVTILIVQVIITWFLIILLAPLLGFNFDIVDIFVVLCFLVVGVSIPSMIYFFVFEKYFLIKED